MPIENPVLRGFCPDPSIVRVGEDYYIATSTFEWFPGVRLHHSRDLVHWRLVGHALTRPSQLDLRGVPDSGGVWAPSLSYADGQFWLITTNVRTCGIGRPFKDLGIYLTTAPRIEGPWSDPVPLNSIGFDPSLFHDDDGRKWLVNMVWDFRKSGVSRFAGIVIQEYDPKQRRLVGPMTKLLEKPVLTEGPNLYKRNGWYYLMLAEGGTGWNHGIAMARSRQLLGPYELDPQEAVLTTRDAPDHSLQKAGHGELVETPAGAWYLVHLASRPVEVERDVGAAPDAQSSPALQNSSKRTSGSTRYCILGRETCLQKVRWSEDCWLRLDVAGLAEAGPGATTPATTISEGGRRVPTSGEATDAKSGAVAAPRLQQPWHPAVSVPAPSGVSSSPWPELAARDDFEAPTLDVSWSALRVPITDDWATLRARRGWLRLQGRESLHSLFHQSLVAKPLRSVHCVAETCVEFRPTHFTQMAGLVCYYDTRTHYYLRLTHDETHGVVLGIVVTDDGGYREPRGSGVTGLADPGQVGSSANPPVSSNPATTEQISVEGWPRCFLRATFDGPALQFAASADGQAWRNIGPVLDATKLSDDYGSALHFTGAMVGVCCQDLGGAGAFADFDYFSLADQTASQSEGQKDPDAFGCRT